MLSSFKSTVWIIYILFVGSIESDIIEIKRPLSDDGKTCDKCDAIKREWTYWQHQILIGHYSVQILSFFSKILVQVDKPFKIWVKKKLLEIRGIFVVMVVTAE